MTLVVSEYMYDSTATVVPFLNMVVLIAFSTIGSLCYRKKMPPPLAIVVKAVMVLCLAGFISVLLFDGSQSSMGRAFRLSHLALILMACRFLLIRRTQDYTQIFLLSMLLMIIAAITSGNIVIAPFYILYLLLIVYCLILYQLQRQVEIVRATHFTGRQPSKIEIDRSLDEIKFYWRQLKAGRFKLTCGVILVMAMCFSIAVFLLFPRLEAGMLLGSTFGSSSVSGFSNQMELGSIDKNETLKQVVARVAVRQNGRSIASKHTPIYLRCMSLDSYNASESIQGRYVWIRSFMNYFLDQPLLHGPISPTDGVIEQRILLNPINSSYLPGVFPVIQVSGLESERLVSSALDNTVTRYYFHSQDPIDYQVASQSHFDSQKALEHFKHHLFNMGNQWFGLGYNSLMISKNTLQLARTIAGDLSAQRFILRRKQRELFGQWRRHLSKTAKKNTKPSDVKSWSFLQRLKEPDEPDSEYLRLTSDLFDISRELAVLDRKISQKIVLYLSSHYTYTIEPPAFYGDLDDEDAEDEDDYSDPVSEFIDQKSDGGNCEYFASAMVQLCRSLGIPARLAVGFLVHEYLPESDYYLVRQRDAHSWVEIYTADEDWIKFDPTPLGVITPGGQNYLGKLFGPFQNFFEQLQFNWLKFSASTEGQDSLRWASDLTDWVEQLDTAEQALQDEDPSFFQNWFTLHSDESYFYLFLRWMIFFLFLIDVGIGISVLTTWGIPRFILWRKHKRQLSAYGENTIGFYREMLITLQDIHLYKQPHQTSREFAFQVMGYSKDFSPVGRISEVYYRLRFGNEALNDENKILVDKALQHLKMVVLSLKKTTERPWSWETED